MSDNDGSFFAELKRRNVYRVGLAYAIASWLFLQALDLIVSLADAPDWIGKLFLGLLLVGLPIVLILSWVYELTPEGIKREKDVDRSASITAKTGSRLDKTIIGVFVVAAAWVVIDLTLLNEQTDPVPAPAQQDEIVVTEVVDKSIAVLPFMNMSEDTGAGHFSDGLADTVLHKLAQIESLRVVARNSSFQFRGQNVDIRDVGEQLNVANILEGSVQAAGNKIRVTAQLIQAETGYHLWSGNFDRELNDVFAIQDEIAEKVVAALQVSLGDDDAARLARRDTDNVDAFREYSLALREMDDYNFESLDRAVVHLDRAIDLDASYALAWAMKGLAQRHMMFVGSRTFEQYELETRAAATRALEIDPELPLAMALIAELDYEDRKHDSALGLIRRAVDLAPSDANVIGIYASILVDDLRPFEAADTRLLALELDPLSIPLHQVAAGSLGRLGRIDEALAIGERMRTLNPDAPAGYWATSYIHSNVGNWTQALLLMVKAAELDPSDPIGPLDVAWYYLALGLEQEAQAWLEKSRSVNPEHPAALASLLVLGAGEPELSEATVRTARRLLIKRAASQNSARGLAYGVLLREAWETGYYDEYLAWARHFAPELFDPAIDNVDDYGSGAGALGQTMILAGQEEQGRRLIDLAWQRVEAVDAARKRAPDFNSFDLAAMTGDRDKALAVLRGLADTTHSDHAGELWVTRHGPWIRPYHDEPEYQAFVDRLEQLAAEQRALLLELNGGAYPLPE